jgi:D-xylose 1-dehydrogenase (NADP+, D-xylono-1,5-lactone-forming)
MNKVRWGLLSTANINRRVIPAITNSSNGELVAVASRNQRIAETYALQWEIPKAFGDYDSMLNSGTIDAVYIGLPNHLHAEWSIRAMQAGIHVLCEKPFAISVQEVDEMIAASRKHNRYLQEAFMYRHHPQTKLAAEWVKSGKLGELRLIQSSFHFMLDEIENVRLNADYGGGSLWDVGVYPVSFAQYIMGGPPEWVVGDQRTAKTGIDETFSGQLHYSGNRMALISSSFSTPLFTFAEIIGNQGRLRLNRPFIGQQDPGRRMTFYPLDGDSVEVPVPDQELYIGEIDNMNGAILEARPTLIRLEESRDHVRTTLALYESAKRGDIVRM